MNRRSEIAIEVLVACVRAKGQMITTVSVAESCHATKLHTAQVVSRLTRLGWLKAHRGRGGGLTAGSLTEGLSVADVVLQFGARSCDSLTSCSLIGLMEKAEQLQMAYLDLFSIFDLAEEENSVARNWLMAEALNSTSGNSK